MSRRLAWMGLGLVALVTLAYAAASGPGSAETAAERTARLASGVRCPTCQGLSAAESDAKAATAVRAEIARRVGEGESDESIRAALVERYGEQILLTPPSTGIGSLVWALPVAGLVVGAAGVGAALVRRGRTSASQDRPSTPTGTSTARRLAAGALVAAVAVGAGFLVARSAGERRLGDTATGSIDLGPAELLLEARVLLSEGEAVEALRRYDQVLEQDPAHPEALAYRGWLVRLAGRPEEGLELVEAAVAADPEFPDAHLFRGVILLDDMNRPAEAAEELRRFLELDPGNELAGQARETLERAEAAASA